MQVGIIGAGSWGTALALTAARAGNKVTLLTRSLEQSKEIKEHHTNTKALPGITFEVPLESTTVPHFLSQQDLLVMAVPTQVTRQVAEGVASFIPANLPIILTAKGIEYHSSLLMSEVMAEILPQNPFAILSGPTFAKEVAQKLPTAVTLATTHDALIPSLINGFSTPEFRIYPSRDIMGVQVSGALKNVLAIASGIVTGRNLGDNARAALISRGLSELVRLGRAKGGMLETFLGLSGCGDLILTCTSTQSRNMKYGLMLGRGEEDSSTILKEGVYTAQSVVNLARQLQVSMPISEAVCRIVTKQSTIDEEIKNLLERALPLNRASEVA